MRACIMKEDGVSVLIPLFLQLRVPACPTTTTADASSLARTMELLWWVEPIMNKQVLFAPRAQYCGFHPRYCFFFMNSHVLFLSNIWTSPNTSGDHGPYLSKNWFLSSVGVASPFHFRSFSSLKISTRWTMWKHIQVRMWLSTQSNWLGHIRKRR